MIFQQRNNDKTDKIEMEKLSMIFRNVFKVFFLVVKINCSTLDGF